MSTERSAADEEIMRLATARDDDADPPETKADDPLELGGDEAPEATPEQVEAEKEKKRSRPVQQRFDILTARLHEAERRAAALEAKLPTDQAPENKEPDPNDYEFGEGDTKYMVDKVRFEMRKEAAEEKAKTDEAAAANAKKAEVVGKLQDGMASIEKSGAEKYDDFEAKIGEAVEARGGEPLHPLVSVGIAVSPAGADIAYKLATDGAAADKIEALAKSNPQQAAIAFGELEGEFMGEDDTDLDPSDPLDMARMLGRMKARLAGKKAPSPAERKTTKAQAPESKARGGNGQFEVDDSTDDFASFERKHMGKNG